MNWVGFLMHWFAVHTGSVANTSGQPYYNFWSGLGSDFGEVVLIGGVIQIVRHTNCHVKGCWRVGKHPVVGTPYKVCRVHHPDLNRKITHQDVIDAHRAAKERSHEAHVG